MALSMPTDVTLYPILPAWAGDLSAWEEREIVWIAMSMAQLKQGWLNSRTPTQYLTVRRGRRRIRSEVLESGEKLRVKNQLGQPIKTLVVVKSEGKFYLGEKIDAEVRRRFETNDRDEAVESIQQTDRWTIRRSRRRNWRSANRTCTPLRSRARYQPYWRYGLQPSTAKLSENLANARTLEFGRPERSTGAGIAAAKLRGDYGDRAGGRAWHLVCQGRSEFSRDRRTMVSRIAHDSHRCPQIELRRLHRVFEHTHAVNDVSFEVYAGEVFGYIGPNGAGKTTSMRILATLDEPTAAMRLSTAFRWSTIRIACGGGWGSCRIISARIKT